MADFVWLKKKKKTAEIFFLVVVVVVVDYIVTDSVSCFASLWYGFELDGGTCLESELTSRIQGS